MGVDNEKALELTNSTVFHRCRQWKSSRAGQQNTFFIFQPDFNKEISPKNATKHPVAWSRQSFWFKLNFLLPENEISFKHFNVFFEKFQRFSRGLQSLENLSNCSRIYSKMFLTDFIFRQQENLVANQKCQAGFRPLCNKILFLSCLDSKIALCNEIYLWYQSIMIVFFGIELLLGFTKKREIILCFHVIQEPTLNSQILEACRPFYIVVHSISSMVKKKETLFKVC
jgi:hypothetical protein